MPAFMALIVTFIELLLEHELAWGSFINYVDQILHIFDHLNPRPEWTIVDILHKTYPLFWTFY